MVTVAQTSDSSEIPLVTVLYRYPNDMIIKTYKPWPKNTLVKIDKYIKYTKKLYL